MDCPISKPVTISPSLLEHTPSPSQALRRTKVYPSHWPQTLSPASSPSVCSAAHLPWSLSPHRLQAYLIGPEPAVIHTQRQFSLHRRIPHSQLPGCWKF